MEHLNCRDVRVLVEIIRRGTATYKDLAFMGYPATIYSSINRLIASGYVRKLDRGVYEATPAGLSMLRRLKRMIESALSTSVSS